MNEWSGLQLSTSKMGSDKSSVIGESFIRGWLKLEVLSEFWEDLKNLKNMIKLKIYFNKTGST